MRRTHSILGITVVFSMNRTFRPRPQNPYRHQANLHTPSSFATVNTSLTTNTIPSRTYLIATLVARVSDGQATAYPTASPSPTGAASSGRKRSTSLPMIILYCVTGIVVSLFLAVVLTGVSALRSLRAQQKNDIADERFVRQVGNPSPPPSRTLRRQRPPRRPSPTRQPRPRHRPSHPRHVPCHQIQPFHRPFRSKEKHLRISNV